MEIVDIVNHLRLNIHNILEARPASYLHANWGQCRIFNIEPKGKS